MNYIYPAVFYPEDDGRFSVVFPDLNDLATYGDKLLYVMAILFPLHPLLTLLQKMTKTPSSIWYA